MVTEAVSTEMSRTQLWRNPDFLKLWLGQATSVFGSQMSHLALPLLAAVTLQASPSQMGILQALEFAPFFLVGLLAGVWVDRLYRRPILIAADLGRGILLGSIPAAYALGRLSMEYLYVVGFLAGVLTVFFDVSYQSYLPSLVPRQQLVEANSRLEATYAAAALTGPGMAGALVNRLGAPLVIALDAVSYFVSALALLAIRQAERAPAPGGTRHNLWQEMGEGLAFVTRHPLLRAIAACTATANLFFLMGQAVFILYVTRALGLDATMIGLVYTVGSVGGLVGALGAGALAARIGAGPAIIASAALGGAATWLVPLTALAPHAAVPLLMLAQSLAFFSNQVYNINQVSLRQAITPDRLLGRMNASMRFIVWGTMPIGSLAGGFLGERLGLVPTLAVSAAGASAAFLWILLSPVRALRDQPVPPAEQAPEPVPEEARPADA